MCARLLSCVWVFATPSTETCQAPLSMEFSRQESWSRLPFLTPGDFPDPGIKPACVESLALADRFFTTKSPSIHGLRCEHAVNMLLLSPPIHGPAELVMLVDRFLLLLQNQSVGPRGRREGTVRGILVHRIRVASNPEISNCTSQRTFYLHGVSLLSLVFPFLDFSSK